MRSTAANKTIMKSAIMSSAVINSTIMNGQRSYEQHGQAQCDHHTIMNNAITTMNSGARSYAAGIATGTITNSVA